MLRIKIKDDINKKEDIVDVDEFLSDDIDEEKEKEVEEVKEVKDDENVLSAEEIEKLRKILKNYDEDGKLIVKEKEEEIEDEDMIEDEDKDEHDMSDEDEEVEEKEEILDDEDIHAKSCDSYKSFTSLRRKKKTTNDSLDNNEKLNSQWRKRYGGQ